MGVVAVLVHQLEHLAVHHLDEAAHVGQVLVHGAALREVGAHPLHQLAEAAVGDRLVLEYHQQRRRQVTHALHVARVQPLPHVRAHDVAQLVQVVGREEPVVSVATLHVLLDAVQVERERVQQLVGVHAAVAAHWRSAAGAGLAHGVVDPQVLGPVPGLGLLLLLPLRLLRLPLRLLRQLRLRDGRRPLLRLRLRLLVRLGDRLHRCGGVPVSGGRLGGHAVLRAARHVGGGQLAVPLSHDRLHGQPLGHGALVVVPQRLVLRRTLGRRRAEGVVSQQEGPDVAAARRLHAAEVDVPEHLVGLVPGAVGAPGVPQSAGEAAASVGRLLRRHQVGADQAGQVGAHRAQVAAVRHPAVEGARQDLPPHAVTDQLDAG